MKKTTIALALFSLFGTSAVADVNFDGDMKFSRTYQNTNGPVTFHHQEHAERFLDDCGFCHSALATFGGEVNELFGHTICKKCHESHNGPADCNQCHQGSKVKVSKQ